MEPSHKLKCRLIIPFLIAVFFISISCGEEKQPRTASTPKEPRVQWFWRDRLSLRPQPLPLPPDRPGTRRTAEEIFERSANRPPASLNSEISALAALGASAVPLLRERIDDSERNIRFLAVAALGRMGGPHTREPLLLALRDEWSATAVVAADCVAEDAAGKRDLWIIPRLIKTLGPFPIDFNPHLMVRVKAARALLNFGNYSGTPFLIKILKDNTPAEDPRREWFKTTQLAWIKEESLDILSEVVGEDFGFRIDAPPVNQAEAARKFEKWWIHNRLRLWANAPPLDDPLLAQEINDIINGLNAYQIRNKDCAQYMLRMLGPPVFPYLAKALSNDDFYIRFHALDIISELAHLSGRQSGSWSDPVQKSLKDEHPAVRAQACRALGLLGQNSSIPYLEELLSDADGDVRLKAVEALGSIGGQKAEKCLEDLFSNTPPGQLRVEILAALARHQPDRIHDLVNVLLTEDPVQQDWALQKVISLTGKDFDFPLSGSREERERAAASISRALKNL